jgi:putative oxidoreductase
MPPCDQGVSAPPAAVGTPRWGYREANMSHLLNLISRILMSALFIVYGYAKLTNVDSVLNSAATKRFMDLAMHGAAAPTWLGYLIGAIEFFGGIAIILGIATRWIAGLFVIYLIIITYLGHPFWMTGTPADKVNFYKNLVIIGAFLMLAVSGGGAHSVDGRMVASRSARTDYA